MDHDKSDADGAFRWENFRGIGKRPVDPSEPPRFWPTLARFFRAVWTKQMHHPYDSSRVKW